MFACILALCLIKQVGSLIRSTWMFTCFHGSVRSFVSDAMCSLRVSSSVALLLSTCFLEISAARSCCVTSLGKPLSH